VDDEEDVAGDVGDEDLQDALAELEADPSAQPAVEAEATTAASKAPRPEASSAGQDPVAEPAALPGAPAAAQGARRFEFTRGRSNKFWEITLAGTQHTVRFGRIGTKGQTVTKTFEDAAAARRDCQRLIRSKQAKGYRETR